MATANTVLGTDTQFRALVEAVTGYAIFMLDPEGRVATWNPGAERLQGYRAEEIVGRHLSTFYPAEDVKAGIPDRELREAAETGACQAEGERVRKDGTRFLASVSITKVVDGSGNLAGFAKVTRDITLQRQATLAVERERMARALIPGVIHTLFQVGLDLQAATALAGDARLVKRIESAIDDLDQAISLLRSEVLGTKAG